MCQGVRNRSGRDLEVRKRSKAARSAKLETGVNGSMDALDMFRAESEHFDLIITDMTLPKMTGIDSGLL
jgi:CheY-like chemotaxis protein